MKVEQITVAMKSRNNKNTIECKTVSLIKSMVFYYIYTVK